MSIKILYIIDKLDHGGTERQLARLIEGLDKNIFLPHLCTLKAPGGMQGELLVSKFCLNFKSFNSPSLFLVLRRLICFIRTNQIDLVQTFFQDPCLLAALSRPFHQARLIGSFRDLGFWRTKLESHKMRFAVKAYSGFIANSQAVKTHFACKDQINPQKIKIIYNGVDLKQIPLSDQNEIIEGPLIVGIVANLNRPVKRVQDFILAVPLLLKKTVNVRFIIVGDGYLRPELEKLATTLGVKKYINFVGSQPQPLEFVKTFRVGVITSETEGFSNSILEYMACGIPVVATKTGGNLELIRDGENGFLVPVGAVDILADRVYQLLQEPLNTSIGKNNQTKIFQYFSLSSMIKQYEEYYQGLIQKI